MLLPAAEGPSIVTTKLMPPPRRLSTPSAASVAKNPGNDVSTLRTSSNVMGVGRARAERRERHRDAMVEVGLDPGPAGRAALDLEPVGELARRDPEAARLRASATMRSLSLTRSSPAPVTREVPGAALASTTQAGTSSTRRGTHSAGTSNAVERRGPAHA